MHAVEEVTTETPPQNAEGPPAPPPETESDASIRTLAQEGLDYLRSFLQLVLGETAVARISLRRLLLAALIVPAVALTVWFAFNALIAALIERWLHSWIAAVAIVFVLDIAMLAAFLFLMQRWWRDLSLPRSRAALARLMDRP